MLKPCVFDTLNFYSCMNSHFVGVVKKAILIQRYVTVPILQIVFVQFCTSETMTMAMMLHV